MVLNIQSIKRKENLLADYLRSKAINIVIVTEIWLTNQDRDVIWMESNELVKDGYLISAVNRDRRRGGGLILMYRCDMTVSKISQMTYRSYEVEH